MIESENGIVLSSFIRASISAIKPFLLNAMNISIGKINPNIITVESRINLLAVTCSSVKANIVKIIIVKDGGTKSVEIILANFMEKEPVNFVI